MKMMFSIFIAIVAFGCSTTTYLNLKESSDFSISRQLRDCKKDNNKGVSVVVIPVEGEELKGELLAVLDTSMIILTQYFATGAELKNSKYPTTRIQKSNVKEITIEGKNYVWWGIGAGYGVGAIIGYVLGDASASGEFEKDMSTAFSPILGGMVGVLIGGIVGYNLSTREFVFREIPHGYDLNFIKSLARYQDELPEFLEGIK